MFEKDILKNKQDNKNNEMLLETQVKQKEIEMKSARDQQLEMMERMFGPSQSMTQEELDIGRQLEEKLAPTFNENLGTESPNQFNIQGLLKPNVRNELSLGSLDDAIGEAFKNRGIGALS